MHGLRRKQVSRTSWQCSKIFQQLRTENHVIGLIYNLGKGEFFLFSDTHGNSPLSSLSRSFGKRLNAALNTEKQEVREMVGEVGEGVCWVMEEGDKPGRQGKKKEGRLTETMKDGWISASLFCRIPIGLSTGLLIEFSKSIIRISYRFTYHI